MYAKNFFILLMLISGFSLYSNSWGDLFTEKNNLIERRNCQILKKQYKSFQDGNAPTIANQRIKNILIVENNEKVVDIRLQNHPRIYMLPDPEKSFASPDCCSGFYSSSQIRASIFNKLKKMISHLDLLAEEFGYKSGEVDIVVFEGIRDVNIQEQLFQNKYDEIKNSNFSLTDDELYKEASKWVSPTKNNIPVHSTGAAIDIRLKANGLFIDMGKFGVIWGANVNAPTFSEDILYEQKKNRLYLLMAAAMADLSNYVYEFWHFSYGDRYDAFWKDEKVAVYDSVSGEAQKSAESITLQWESDSDWEREEEIFVRSFLEVYKDFSEEQLGVKQDKEEWLRSAFRKKIDAFKKGDGKIFLASVKKGDKVVGFSAFNETENKGEVNIKQLAVDPEYWRQGIGKKLIFSINKKIDGIQKYVLVTRYINIGARNFYIKLGFKECGYECEGLDPKNYVGYELEVEEKNNL